MDEAGRHDLEQCVYEQTAGPFNNTARFHLVSSTDEDVTSLRELGTYGMIKNPAGFIVGALKDSPDSLEDYGYMMETIILKATDLNLRCYGGLRRLRTNSRGGSLSRRRTTSIISISRGLRDIIKGIGS
jgi:hypothetical protein